MMQLTSRGIAFPSAALAARAANSRGSDKPRIPRLPTRRKSRRLLEGELSAECGCVNMRLSAKWFLMLKHKLRRIEQRPEDIFPGLLAARRFFQRLFYDSNLCSGGLPGKYCKVQFFRYLRIRLALLE